MIMIAVFLNGWRRVFENVLGAAGETFSRQTTRVCSTEKACQSVIIYVPTGRFVETGTHREMCVFHWANAIYH